MKRSAILGALVFVVVAGVAGCDGGDPPVEATLTNIHENIFQVSCSASVCHGGAGPVDGLDLVADPLGTTVNVDSVEVPGMKRIVPGDPENSVLFLVLKGPLGNCEKMPQGSSEGLPADQIALIETWIKDGAKDN